MIVELNGRKLNKVMPEKLLLGHLEKLTEILQDVLVKSVKVNKETQENLPEFIGAALNAKMFSRILPVIYLNENEEFFNEDTYEDRVKFFKQVELTDEMESEVGKLASMCFIKSIKSIHVLLNPTQMQG